MINVDNLKKSFINFNNKTPFPFAIIDNFFNIDVANNLSTEFPNFDSDVFNGKYENQIEYKRTCNVWDRFPKLTYQVFSYLNSQNFLNLLSECTGIAKLYPDHGLHGGGWHIHPYGGKLNPHLDYSLHPKTGLQRKYNLLVYVNPVWQSGWGGELGLWSANNALNAPGELTQIIEPLYNRAVIFDTTVNSWHGLVNSVVSPETECRKSLALYYLIDPPAEVDSRGRALFAPTDEQKNDTDVLNLIQRRSLITDQDIKLWSRN
jgi:Rps23 Pro-64 3,4-dihydroxylase Tpa1-like proline 4-hydroxylase